MKKSTGISVVEFCISLLVIGLLVMISFHYYQHFTIRSQVNSGILFLEPVKHRIFEHYTLTGKLPSSEKILYLDDVLNDPDNKFTTNITLYKGQIHQEYGKKANEALRFNILILYPYRNHDNQLIWVCGYASPPSFAKEIDRVDYSAPPEDLHIEKKYLPEICQ